MKCCVVRDLLPGYLDGLTSEETNEEAERHLKDCTACKKVYDQMSAKILTEELPKRGEVDFLKKLRRRIRQKHAFGAFLICALAILVVGFLTSYDVPVAYDPEKMTVGMSQIAYVPNDYGLMEWVHMDVLESETAQAVARGDYDAMDEIRLILQESVQSDGLTSSGRTIERNGETVRVVYYCYTRTLWNHLFPETANFMDHSVSCGNIYEGSFFRESNYRTKRREIYYLPMGNMNRLDRLSNEEFDAWKEQAVLVWSGVI